jgi:hypothetical protein
MRYRGSNPLQLLMLLMRRRTYARSSVLTTCSYSCWRISWDVRDSGTTMTTTAAAAWRQKELLEPPIVVLNAAGGFTAVADYVSPGDASEGPCVPSAVMNGMLVWESPSRDVPQEATFANDEQVNQIAVYCPDIPYNPRWQPIPLNEPGHSWSLVQCLEKLAAAPRNAASNSPVFASSRNKFDEKFAGKLLSSAGVDFDGRDPLLATGVLFVVGEMHWRAVLFDTLASTLYLFDPMGGNGWQRNDAGRVKRLLEGMGARYGFDVEVMNLSVQHDAFQCGPWALFISRGFGAYLLLKTASTSATSPRDWPSFCQRWLAEGAVSLNAGNANAVFIASQRRDLTTRYCDNPRSRAQPAAGAYAPEVRVVMHTAHFALDHSSYEYKFIPEQTMMGHPRQHLNAPAVFAEGVPLVDSRGVVYSVRTRNGEPVPCGRPNCAKHLQGCCGLLALPSETADLRKEECQRLDNTEREILQQQAAHEAARNGDYAPIYCYIYLTVPYLYYLTVPYVLR